MGGEAMLESRELARLWSGIVGRLEFDTPAHQFRTWLKPTRALGFEDGSLVVEASSSFACDWLTEQLGPAIATAVGEAAGPAMNVRFVPRRAADVQDAFDCSPRQALPAGPIGSIARDLTFERYLVSEGNRAAVSTCHDLIDGQCGPGGPLVIFGSPGMGKTHLLHALAGRALEQGWSLACLRAEEFTNRYMEALRAKRIPDFQASIRRVRLFIIDDLQYLEGKDGMQNELVHTIDTVREAGGAVACGSERPPLGLGFVERLATRLAEGTSVHVRPFCYTERLEFVRRVSSERNAGLPDWAVERIANINARSVREVLGAVNLAVRLARCGDLTIGVLDTELLQLSLEAVVAPRGVCDAELVAKIADYFETTLKEVQGTSRKSAVTAARAVAVAALRAEGRTNTEIATLLGGRDRTTISQLSGRGEGLIAANAALSRLLAG